MLDKQRPINSILGDIGCESLIMARLGVSPYFLVNFCQTHAAELRPGMTTRDVVEHIIKRKTKKGSPFVSVARSSMDA